MRELARRDGLGGSAEVELRDPNQGASLRCGEQAWHGTSAGAVHGPASASAAASQCAAARVALLPLMAQQGQPCSALGRVALSAALSAHGLCKLTGIDSPNTCLLQPWA